MKDGWGWDLAGLDVERARDLTVRGGLERNRVMSSDESLLTTTGLRILPVCLCVICI